MGLSFILGRRIRFDPACKALILISIESKIRISVRQPYVHVLPYTHVKSRGNGGGGSARAETRSGVNISVSDERSPFLKEKYAVVLKQQSQAFP